MSQKLCSKSLKLWEANSDRKKNSHMTQFLDQMMKKGYLNEATWQELYAWSIRDLNSFWQEVAFYLSIIWKNDPNPHFVFEQSSSMRKAKWFRDYKLNYAENLLWGDKSENVLICLNERTYRKVYTRQDLSEQVQKYTFLLKKLGVKKGDHISAVLTNGVEALSAMLATTSLGAIWSSCSPDFGCPAICERLNLVKPKVIFWSSDYTYKSKVYDCLNKLKDCMKSFLFPSVFLVSKHTGNLPSFLDKAVYLLEPLLASIPIVQAKESFEFYPSNFDDPLFILFSSGTTAAPKAIVHGVGGTLLQHKKELLLHCDLHPGDRLWFYTNCGWMMWNWMISSLSLGSTLVIYDGSIVGSKGLTFWDICEKEKISIAGLSPKFLDYCISKKHEPKKSHELLSLKTILSTGAPLLAEHYKWVYTFVKEDLHLASISGGSDLISCFMLGNPLLPVYAGQIQAAGLGMSISARDDEGTPVQGEKGELCCDKPFVSMPLCFLDDKDGKKYQQAYFERYKNLDIWCHGDYVEFTDQGGIIVLGRSDATLNVGGIRIGTGEIYGQLESFKEILDSVAVEITKGKETSFFLLLKINSAPLEQNDELINRVKKHLAFSLSPRHVPQTIKIIKDIPYTQSGKKMELLVKALLNGQTIKNISSLANPDCLAEYDSLAASLALAE